MIQLHGLYNYAEFYYYSVCRDLCLRERTQPQHWLTKVKRSESYFTAPEINLSWILRLGLVFCKELNKVNASGSCLGPSNNRESTKLKASTTQLSKLSSIRCQNPRWSLLLASWIRDYTDIELVTTWKQSVKFEKSYPGILAYSFLCFLLLYQANSTGTDALSNLNVAALY